MTIYKNRDISPDIKVTGVDVGNIGAKFFTEDENTGSVTIYIKHNSQSFNLTATTMKPKLDLFLQDGSIFLDEPLEIVDAANGIVKYSVTQGVIKHVGIVNAKLFLHSDTESVHVANFRFEIGDSGVDKAIAKSIDVNLIDDAITAVINANPDRFRGEAFNYEDFTTEQLESLKVKGDDGDSAYEVWLSLGNTGTKQDFINALKIKGDTGLSAYELWKSQGNTGTLTDFLNSLKSTAKSTISIVDGQFAVDGVKTGAVANESQAIDYSKNYVQSRGESLVTNGTGLLGSNTNFSALTYVSDEVKVGAGSFYTNKSEYSVFTDEKIPVDTSKKYELSMWAKSKLGKANQIAGFACLDIDGNTITPEHYATDNTSIVTLTQPLKKGDTKIYVSDITPWTDTTAPWTNGVGASRGILLWGYKNAKGYTYPDGTYSRYSGMNIIAINTSEKSITLNGGFPHDNKSANDLIFPVGHKISRTMSGNQFSYNLILQTPFPTDWTRYSGTITGISRTISDADKFRFGTAFIKPYYLLNRTNPDETWISGIEFKEATTNIPTWISGTLLNGFTGTVKYYKDPNNLVTVDFYLTVGSTTALNTVIATLPTEYIPNTTYLSIPAFNISTGVPDLLINVGNSFKGLTIAKALTTGHRIQGQITYRVG